MRVTLPNDFTPRDYQRRLMRYFDDGGKRAACVWHRRAGKDITGLHQTGKMAHERTGVYWHMLPTYRQAKKAIWDGFTRDGKRIVDSVFPPAIVKRKNESEMLVELKCGSIVQLIGSDTVDNLVGAGPVGVTFSEFSLSKPSAWNLIRPMLAENGGWASFIYTPRGNNHGKKLWDMAKQNPAWFSELLTVHDTKALPASILDDERAEGMPEELIRQEYLCDFKAALVGAVWGDLIEKLENAGGLQPFEHERDGIFTSWDLGISDSTSIWLWRLSATGVDFVDHYSAHGKPMEHFFLWLDQRKREMGYRYVRHFVPHDAAQRTLQTGLSVLDQFREECRKERWQDGSRVEIGPKLGLVDGLQAGRWLLQQPVRFNPRCGDGIESLRQYHYEYDEDRKTYGNKPEHDWSSHDADGFRYTAIVVKVTEMIHRAPEKKPPPKPIAPNTPTAAELFVVDEGPQRSRI